MLGLGFLGVVVVRLILFFIGIGYLNVFFRIFVFGIIRLRFYFFFLMFVFCMMCYRVKWVSMNSLVLFLFRSGTLVNV